MSQVIIPKSDQINADDLLSGSMTIEITGVKVSGGQEQPVSMFFAGSAKAYRPCKSMARVLVSAWGADSSKYIGRSLTLYCDPRVKWGGMEVGGIRISHMSDIDSEITMALTVTRANKRPFTVRPIVKQERKPLTPEERVAKTIATFAALGVDEQKLRSRLGKDIPEASKAELEATYAFFETQKAPVENAFGEPAI